jgi:carbonic anhydrase
MEARTERPHGQSPPTPAPATAGTGVDRHVGRRSLLRSGGTAALAAFLCACASDQPETSAGGDPTTDPAAETMGTGRDDTVRFLPDQALARLQAGNARFVGGRPIRPDQAVARRTALDAGQHPFAQVLACADSRIPPELVFDQGLGDLFVTRSAGQVIDHAVLGTVQFGVAELGTPLILVLGHEKCGAVQATVEAVEKKAPPSGTDIDALVAAIRPVVEKAEEDRPADLLHTAVQLNVAAEVDRLAAAPVLSTAIKEKKLRVVGAVYSLTTGAVVFS